MEPLHSIISLGPLAAYLAVVGWLNLRRQATVVPGYRDTLALAIALAGLVLIGPFQLFMPMDAAEFFGPMVWIFLISLFLLLVTFIILNERPRLVFYSISPEMLRPLVSQVALKLDPAAQWAGDTLTIPAVGVELRLESTSPFRNTMLIANHDRQSFLGWKALAGGLRHELASVQVPRSLQGGAFLLMAGLLAGYALLGAAENPNGVAQSLFQLLRL